MAYVDWEFAKTTGRTLVPAGPVVSPAEARAEVEAIREAAREARQPVADTARMQTPTDAPDALVVDRATWIAVNADSMAALLDPAVDAIVSKRNVTPGPAAQAVGSKVTGAEAGALLAFMSSKVLGQFDIAPGGTAGAAPGRPEHRRHGPRAERRPRRLPAAGCACTRRPTACSSPPTRGCAST